MTGVIFLCGLSGTAALLADIALPQSVTLSLHPTYIN